MSPKDTVLGRALGLIKEVEWALMSLNPKERMTPADVWVTYNCTHTHVYVSV